MSGIAGLLRLDDGAADPEAVASMLRRLAHRGPDAQRCWVNGRIGLAHAAHFTTPESVSECQPWSAAPLPLTLVADARLDNRGELLAALDPPDANPAHLTDAGLILLAYARWGPDCVTRLAGDFAFALWDAAAEQLVCARDRIGVRPLYYWLREGGSFAFASEIKALLALREIPRRLNLHRARGFLDGGAGLEDPQTFYEGIRRLPPAHVLTVRVPGHALRRYWALDPSRRLPAASPGEYAEAFRERLTEAVRCRLRSRSPVGSMLSGGLDSSSVACLARTLLAAGGGPPLHTFSVVFPGLSACDERRYINAVLAAGGFEPSFVTGDTLHPLEDLDRMVASEDQPFFAPNLYLHWALYRSAAERRVRVLLDGFDGDTTVSHGLALLPELVRRGRWIAAAVETWLVARRHGRPLRRVALRHVARPLAGRGGPRTERDAHYAAMTRQLVPLTLEVADHAAAAFGIEPRYPFFDHRLMEFCLALPPEQKLHRGWTRVVMRRALEGVLPAAVQWRGGKTDLSPSFDRAFADATAQSRNGHDALHAWKRAVLSHWLRSTGFTMPEEHGAIT